MHPGCVLVADPTAIEDLIGPIEYYQHSINN